MGFIRKRRIWWESVPEATGYMIYVSKDRGLLIPITFHGKRPPGSSPNPLQEDRVGHSDDWPEFPAEPELTTSGLLPKTRWEIKATLFYPLARSNSLPHRLRRLAG